MHPLGPTILSAYQFNQFVIERNVEGLSHEDSLINPQPDGNNLNWVLGHILAGRMQACRLLGEVAPWSQETIDLYKRGSAAVTYETALPLSELMDALAATQKLLTRGLQNLPDESEGSEGDDRSLAQQVYGLAWHEAYHAGQTDYLRRLAGHLEGGVR